MYLGYLSVVIRYCRTWHHMVPKCKSAGLKDFICDLHGELKVK